LATTKTAQRAREVATFSLLRLYKKLEALGASSGEDVAIE